MRSVHEGILRQPPPDDVTTKRDREGGSLGRDSQRTGTVRDRRSIYWAVRTGNRHGCEIAKAVLHTRIIYCVALRMHCLTTKVAFHRKRLKMKPDHTFYGDAVGS